MLASLCPLIFEISKRKWSFVLEQAMNPTSTSFVAKRPLMWPV